jgi:hypothetical protein
MLRKTPEEIVDERRKAVSQPTIPAKMNTKEEKHYVDLQWASLVLMSKHWGAPAQFSLGRWKGTVYGWGRGFEDQERPSGRWMTAP